MYAQIKNNNKATYSFHFLIQNILYINDLLLFESYINHTILKMYLQESKYVYREIFRTGIHMLSTYIL